MKRWIWPGVLALAFLAGIAVADEDALPAPPEELKQYEITGETRNCLIVTRIRESRPLDDYHILFFTTLKEVYLVRLKNRCPRLGFEKSFTYATGLNKLCQGDIITVMQNTDPFTPLSHCGLSPFEKLKKKQKPEGHEDQDVSASP